MQPGSAPDERRTPTAIRIHALLLSAALLAGCGEPAFDPPIDCRFCEEWMRPQPPFRIFGNTYYVGVAGLSSVLVDSGDGLVLIDGGLPQSAPVIDANIRELGFRTEDLEYILVSHVHYDHVGGVAALQRLSGAKVLTSRAGSGPLSRGLLAADDPQFSADPRDNRFPASRGVVAVEDGAVVAIGAAAFRALYTPGHTPGGVSWVFESCDDANCLSVVYADSLSPVSLEGFRFAAGPGSAAAELRGSAMAVAALDCDILLAPHPSYFDLRTKFAMRGGDNPFVDDGACKRYANSALEWLQRRLETERGTTAAARAAVVRTPRPGRSAAVRTWRRRAVILTGQPP